MQGGLCAPPGTRTLVTVIVGQNLHVMPMEVVGHHKHKHHILPFSQLLVRACRMLADCTAENHIW